MSSNKEKCQDGHLVAANQGQTNIVTCAVCGATTGKADTPKYEPIPRDWIGYLKAVDSLAGNGIERLLNEIEPRLEALYDPTPTQEKPEDVEAITSEYAVWAGNDITTANYKRLNTKLLALINSEVAKAVARTLDEVEGLQAMAEDVDEAPYMTHDGKRSELETIVAEAQNALRRELREQIKALREDIKQ